MAGLTWHQKNKDRWNAYLRDYRKNNGYGNWYQRKTPLNPNCIHCNKPLNGEWKLHAQCVKPRLAALKLAQESK